MLLGSTKASLSTDSFISAASFQDTTRLGNAEIGERLSISQRTVRNHISNVYDKLGVCTPAQAMVFARGHGFRG